MWRYVKRQILLLYLRLSFILFLYYPSLVLGLELKALNTQQARYHWDTLWSQMANKHPSKLESTWETKLTLEDIPVVKITQSHTVTLVVKKNSLEYECVSMCVCAHARRMSTFRGKRALIKICTTNYVQYTLLGSFSNASKKSR